MVFVPVLVAVVGLVLVQYARGQVPAERHPGEPPFSDRKIQLNEGSAR